MRGSAWPAASCTSSSGTLASRAPSSQDTSSSVRRVSAASRISASCAALRAPMMTDVTPGWRRGRARATCGTPVRWCAAREVDYAVSLSTSMDRHRPSASAERRQGWLAGVVIRAQVRPVQPAPRVDDGRSDGRHAGSEPRYRGVGDGHGAPAQLARHLPAVHLGPVGTGRVVHRQTSFASRARQTGAVWRVLSSWVTERAARRPDSIAPSMNPFQPLAKSPPANSTRPCGACNAVSAPLSWPGR